ncbi:PREDICTED: cytochrome P450 4C1-like, partial [Polistes canadensis]|uniref:cytochrome P450 4C1-like n=1 Tax=Polistes canadensis TaxID=91411 RepID=UPI000718F2AA
ILSNSSYGFEKSNLYDFMKLYVGNGLLTAPVSIWKIHRRILNPVFKKQMISTYVDSIVKNSNRLINNLETNTGKNVNFHHYVHLCTLDIIFESLLKIDLDLQKNLELKFTGYIMEALDLVMQRIIKIWLHPDVTFNNSSLGKRMKALLSILNKITSKIKSSFLDVLFISHNENGEISEQDIRDEINTIVLAGSETTAGTLKFLFLMLASFPDIQQQAYEELYDIYGSSDTNDVPITLEDINKMKYLERVIKETLRLFPAVPFIARTLSSDTEVDENLVIPKNCTVVFSMFTLHRKENYWREPLRFNPDRFLPGNFNQKYFLLFSSGKRGCIGEKFAMIEMKAIAATVLRKFDVRMDNPVSVENVNLKIGIALKPAEPIFLRFNKR